MITQAMIALKGNFRWALRGVCFELLPVDKSIADIFQTPIQNCYVGLGFFPRRK